MTFRSLLARLCAACAIGLVLSPSGAVSQALDATDAPTEASCFDQSASASTFVASPGATAPTTLTGLRAARNRRPTVGVQRLPALTEVVADRAGSVLAQQNRPAGRYTSTPTVLRI